jgi:hypothetical protein
MQCGNNLNKFLTVGTLVARNANEATVAPVVKSGGVCVWQESGVRNQAVGFVLVSLAGVVASIAVKRL